MIIITLFIRLIELGKVLIYSEYERVHVRKIRPRSLLLSPRSQVRFGTERRIVINNAAATIEGFRLINFLVILSDSGW